MRPRVDAKRVLSSPLFSPEPRDTAKLAPASTPRPSLLPRLLALLCDARQASPPSPHTHNTSCMCLQSGALVKAALATSLSSRPPSHSHSHSHSHSNNRIGLASLCALVPARSSFAHHVSVHGPRLAPSMPTLSAHASRSLACSY
jgi:hypothetical protein